MIYTSCWEAYLIDVDKKIPASAIFEVSMTNDKDMDIFNMLSV